IAGLCAVGVFMVLGINAALNLQGDGKPDSTGSTAIGQVTQSPPVPPIAQPKVTPATAEHAAPPPAVVAAPPLDFVMFPKSGGEALFAVADPPKPDEKST